MCYVVNVLSKYLLAYHNPRNLILITLTHTTLLIKIICCILLDKYLTFLVFSVFFILKLYYRRWLCFILYLGPLEYMNYSPQLNTSN